MSSNIVMRRLLLTPTPLRAALIQPQFYPISRYSSSFPVVKPSFWAQLIPKPLRHSSNPNTPQKKKSKDWNPGTFYIWIYLLIGSMSIQLIALKMRFNTSMNRADAKISLLKEVVERVQKGEEVDVQGLLGKGNKQQEEEWEEVLREAENEAELFKQRGKRPAKVEESPSPKDAPVPPPTSNAPSGFY